MKTHKDINPLIKRLKEDIKESKKQEKKYGKEKEHLLAFEEVINQENFEYFIGLIQDLK